MRLVKEHSTTNDVDEGWGGVRLGFLKRRGGESEQRREGVYEAVKAGIRTDGEQTERPKTEK